MAAFEITRMPAASSVFAGRIGARIASMIATVVDWQYARKTRKALDNLSDRELADIGLIRADIDMVAQGYKLR